MAWYRPLQRVDGRWDYTCTNDAGTFPIGYCIRSGTKAFYSLSFEELSPIVREMYRDEAHWEAEKAKHAPRLHHYHGDGHATAKEAEACYRLHGVLETTQRRDSKDSQKKCGICGEWTQKRALIGSGIHREYSVCEGCDTEENLLKLHGVSHGATH
jgi:hypothetical protein